MLYQLKGIWRTSKLYWKIELQVFESKWNLKHAHQHRCYLSMTSAIDVFAESSASGGPSLWLITNFWRSHWRESCDSLERKKWPYIGHKLVGSVELQHTKKPTKKNTCNIHSRKFSCEITVLKAGNRVSCFKTRKLLIEINLQLINTFINFHKFTNLDKFQVFTAVIL
jgi:hypothetical protein